MEVTSMRFGGVAMGAVGKAAQRPVGSELAAVQRQVENLRRSLATEQQARREERRVHEISVRMFQRRLLAAEHRLDRFKAKKDSDKEERAEAQRLFDASAAIYKRRLTRLERLLENGPESKDDNLVNDDAAGGGGGDMLSDAAKLRKELARLEKELFAESEAKESQRRQLKRAHRELEETRAELKQARGMLEKRAEASVSARMQQQQQGAGLNAPPGGSGGGGGGGGGMGPGARSVSAMLSGAEPYQPLGADVVEAASLEERSAEYATLEKMYMDLQAKHGRLQKKSERDQQDIDELLVWKGQQTLKTFRLQREKKEGDEVKDKEIGVLQDTVGDLRRQLRHLQDGKQDASAARTDVIRLKGENAGLKKRIELLQQQAREQGEAAKSSEALMAAKQKSIKLQRECDELRAQVDALERSGDEGLRAELQSARKESGKLAKKVQKLKQQLQEAQTEAQVQKSRAEVTRNRARRKLDETYRAIVAASSVHTLKSRLQRSGRETFIEVDKDLSVSEIQ